MGHEYLILGNSLTISGHYMALDVQKTTEEKIFRLRWRMEFADKPFIFGGWNNASQKPESMAAFKNSSGLGYAVIEGENIRTWEIERLVEMGGEDFIQFKWILSASLPGLGVNKNVISMGRVMGMKIVGRDYTAIVYLNGRGKVVPTPEQDRQGFLRAWNN